ncbi:MAG: stage III sporulation protein AC [Clostridiales bacterium]|nr:stage III sporulation protein AC [Clostridiales bacterium]
MGIEVVLRIAGIGILVAVACQLLKQTGRDDIAMLTAVAGLIIVLTMVISLIGSLFDNVRSVFDLY